MISRTFQEFERICARYQVSGSVLEVGAVPSKNSLLRMKSLCHAVEKIGINLQGPYEFEGFRILQGNANDMRLFPDSRFDVVLCNATLEHDKYFWKTVGEIKRVAKSGGLIVIGTPGYGQHLGHVLASSLIDNLKKISTERVLRLWQHGVIPTLRRMEFLRPLLWGTLTYRIHDAPGDYYRFSVQAFREVILEGLDGIEVRTIMLPPIIVGAGIKR